ncbi:MAG: hypothetical protein GC150_07140 [Rhizobiales bacterium]|nr:hypothetical protein [Hyphomicrobiales bacterium]
MALKDLLVAFDGTPGALGALDVALELAARHDAALSGAFVFPPTPNDAMVRQWIRADIVEGMERAQREAAEAVGAVFRARLAERGCRRQVEWIVERGEPGPTLARIGRFHDLMVVGKFVRAMAREPGALEPEDLVQRAGRPLLVVPEGAGAGEMRTGGVVVVAWDGSRAAARALGDALQLVQPGQRVDVVTIETGHTRDLYDPMPERDLVVHLSRHGVQSRVVNVEAPTDRVGHAILDHCNVVHPSYLVMGAYGRAKFGTLRFGCVTEFVLRNMQHPVLISR